MPIFVFCWLLTSLGILALGILSVRFFFSDFYLPIEVAKYIVMTLPFVFGVIYSVKVINRTLRVHTNYSWSPRDIDWSWHATIGVWLILLVSVTVFTDRDQNEQWDFYLVVASMVAAGFALAEWTRSWWANLLLLGAASVQSIGLSIVYGLIFLIGLGNNPQSELGWTYPLLIVMVSGFTLFVWYVLLSPYRPQAMN